MCLLVRPGDSKHETLYFLGPSMRAYHAFPYLLYFATETHSPAPLTANVATLPKRELMLKILKDTVIIYARSRINHLLMNLPSGPADKKEDSKNHSFRCTSPEQAHQYHTSREFPASTQESRRAIPGLEPRCGNGDPPKTYGVLGVECHLQRCRSQSGR